MRASTVAIGLGVVVFALPVPGTFITGALVLLAGLIARLIGN